MKRLTADRVVELHDALVLRYGGRPGLRDRGLLEGSLARPYATFGGFDAFPGPVEKAAAIMHGIITAHPFVDGNKRTGLACALLLLEAAGIESTLSQDDRVELAVEVASGMTLEELTRVLHEAAREP